MIVRTYKHTATRGEHSTVALCLWFTKAERDQIGSDRVVILGDAANGFEIVASDERTAGAVKFMPATSIGDLAQRDKAFSLRLFPKTNAYNIWMQHGAETEVAIRSRQHGRIVTAPLGPGWHYRAQPPARPVPQEQPAPTPVAAAPTPVNGSPAIEPAAQDDSPLILEAIKAVKRVNELARTLHLGLRLEPDGTLRLTV